MTTDRERDAVVDRLLGAALRTPPDAPDACPPATELAAFVEGGLSAAEREVFERHGAGCARCQQALAILGAPEPVLEARRAQRSWLSWPAVRWAVPATAVLATAALLYVVVQPPAQVPQKAKEMAAVATAQAGSPARRAPAALEAVARKPDRSVEPSAATAPTATSGKAAPLLRRELAPAEPAEKPGVAEERRMAKAEAQNQAVAPAQGIVGGIAQAPPQQVMAAPAQAPPIQAPPPATPPPPEQFLARDAAMKQAQAARPAAGAAGGIVRGMTESVIVVQPVTVAAPGGSTLWRVDAGTRISRSRDGGTTWALQPFRASLDVLAGAAPSPEVCWLVGRGGLVLLTTDAERWDVRPFPERADLMAIDARDARSATVTTLDRRRFVTEDSGATWKRQQEQGSSPAVRRPSRAALRLQESRISPFYR